MTIEEIKKVLKGSAFWICPEKSELVQIDIDRTAEIIFKNLPRPDVKNLVCDYCEKEFKEDGSSSLMCGHCKEFGY